MKKRTSLLLLAAVALLVLLAILLSHRQQETVADSFAGQKFFPQLESQINNVAKIDIVDATSSINVHKQDAVWWVNEAFEYYADISVIKQLLLQLSQLEIIEPKTKKAENYAKLGVADPKQGASKKLIVYDANDHVLADVIIGNHKPAGMAGTVSIYVRKSGDEQAWLVKGNVTIPDRNSWQDKLVLDVSADRIKSVSISGPKRATLKIFKDKKEDKNYGMENLPKGKVLKTEAIANSIAAALQQLRSQETMQKSSFTFDPGSVSHADFTTFDNTLISVSTTERDNKHYAWFDVKMADAKSSLTADVETLNKRLSPWVFVVASAQAENLRKKPEDLLKPIEAPAKK